MIVQLEDFKHKNVSKLTKKDTPILRVQLSDGKLKRIDKIKKSDNIISINKGNWKTEKDKVRGIKWEIPKYLLYIRSKAGFRVFIPENWKVITNTEDKIIDTKPKKDLPIIIPRNYNIQSKGNIKLKVKQLPKETRFLGINLLFKKYASELDLTINEKKDLFKVSKGTLLYMQKSTPISLDKCEILSKCLNKPEILEVFYKNKLGLNVYGGKHIVNLPLTIEEDFGYLIGYTIGDGNCSKNLISTTIWVDDKGVEGRLLEISKKYFNFNRAVQNNLLVLPGLITRFLVYSLGLQSGYKANKVTIPELFLERRNIFGKNIIKGLIDSDGSIIGKKYRREMIIYTTSYSSALNINTILLSYGIPTTTIYTDKWYISVSYHYANELANILTSVNHNSKNKDLKIIKKYKDPLRITMYNINNLLRKIREECGLTITELSRKSKVSRVAYNNIELCKRNCTYNYLKKINKVFENKTLDKIADSELKWSKIKHIKKVPNKMKLKFPKIKSRNNIIFVNHIPITF